MDLTPGCRIRPAQVQAICEIDDHAYRNRWIVYAYHDLSDRLRPLLGENASFCTFATWSSRIIGEQIRVEARSGRFIRLVEGLPERIRWIGRPILDVQKKWRARTEGSVGQVMGYGNRMIFHEIAYELSRFVENYEEGGPNPTWDAYREGINATPETDLFPAANLERFREGMHAYYLACHDEAPQVADTTASDLEERDRKQAELVLRGTLLISSYEQFRVDSVLKAALSLFPRRFLRVPKQGLLRLTGCPGLEDVALRRHEQPWRLRHRSPWRRALASLYARGLTRWVLNLEVPKVMDLNLDVSREEKSEKLRLTRYEELRLGRKLNWPLARPGGSEKAPSLYLAPLDELRDRETKAVFDCFNRSKGTPRSCRSRNWSLFDDRMNYIANYFRARQSSPLLFVDLPREYRIVRKMNVSDDKLEELRGIGDVEADTLAARVADESGRHGRDLLPLLVKHGTGPEEMRNDELTEKLIKEWWGQGQGLPCWADDKKLRGGQKFFQQFKVEIASALFNASLPKTYTAWRGAKVLTTTADLLASNPHLVGTDTATLLTQVERRIAETGQMLLDVMGADDGKATPFAPETRAYQAARGVRLFHAAVRQQILYGDKDWDVETLGVPANQEDLLGTLSVFTVVVMEALERMGVQFSMHDREFYVHTWLVIGHFLGIKYELLFEGGSGARPQAPPLDYEGLRVLAYRVYRRQGGFSVDGCRLEKALLDSQSARMWKPFKGLPATSVRAFLGDEAGDDLGVPQADWTRHLIKVMVPFNVVRTYGYHVKGIGWFVRRRSYRLYGRFIKQGRGTRPDWRLKALKPLFARPPTKSTSVSPGD